MAEPGTATEPCTWCGAEVEHDDGFRAYEPAGERRAVFCRLEHVVPWAIQGAHWEAGELTEPRAIDEGPLRLLAVRRRAGRGPRRCSSAHRGAHRIPDDFCSVEHMLEWAKAGGAGSGTSRPMSFAPRGSLIRESENESDGD